MFEFEDHPKQYDKPKQRYKYNQAQEGTGGSGINHRGKSPINSITHSDSSKKVLRYNTLKEKNV